MVGKRNPQARYRGSQKRNFASGIAELAAAVRENRPSRLSSTFCLHVNEVVLAIYNAQKNAGNIKLTTTCEHMDPMAYALPKK